MSMHFTWFEFGLKRKYWVTGNGRVHMHRTCSMSSASLWRCWAVVWVTKICTPGNIWFLEICNVSKQSVSAQQLLTLKSPGNAQNLATYPCSVLLFLNRGNKFLGLLLFFFSSSLLLKLTLVKVLFPLSLFFFFSHQP